MRIDTNYYQFTNDKKNFARKTKSFNRIGFGISWKNKQAVSNIVVNEMDRFKPFNLKELAELGVAVIPTAALISLGSGFLEGSAFGLIIGTWIRKNQNEIKKDKLKSLSKAFSEGEISISTFIHQFRKITGHDFVDLMKRSATKIK